MRQKIQLPLVEFQTAGTRRRKGNNMERRVFSQAICKLVSCGVYGCYASHFVFSQPANKKLRQLPSSKDTNKGRARPPAKVEQSTSSPPDATANQQWKLYRFDELGFHVYFPAPPKPSPTASPAAQAYEAWINAHRLRVVVVPSKVASVYNQNILEGFLEAKQRAGRKINAYSLLANNVLISTSTNWEIINNQNTLIQHQELDILQAGWACNASVSAIQSLYD